MVDRVPEIPMPDVHPKTMVVDHTPRRFRWPCQGGMHPNGRAAVWRYGCYWPGTDLVVGDMGTRGTGIPVREGLEWIDPIDDLPWAPKGG